MKVKVRKILLCVFFALFIVTLFTASFSLGRYSSVQSSESNYDDDFEYTLYDSIIVNTIDEFFAAISNGYNYIIIGDAIKDPLIIAGSMSDIRDDLIIDLNGHEIQRNSRDPLLNVTTGFALTIIDRVGTGSMYNPVGSVIQVSGGTLTVQNGIFESGPRSDDSRDAKRHNDVNVNDYNEYVKDTPDDDELYSTPGGGSIRDTDTVTVYRNSNIGTGSTSNTYGDSIGTVELPIITPQTTGRGVVSGSMYFDDVEGQTTYYSVTDNQGVVRDIIKDDTYLYYTYEADNMQYSTVADKSTANYYYRYYVNGGELGDTQDSVNSYFAYASDQTLKDPNDSSDQRILVTVYVFNDVKYYAAEQSGYTDSSGTSGFAAVKMQSGNLYVRGGTYYSYFGKDNTFGVQSTGGLMTVNPTGSNAINFYAYQNGVCVECTVDEPTENEMLNISSGNFYSELGDTVRVKNGSLTIGTADFTKDVGSANANNFGDNGDVIDISGGTLTINTRAGFDVSGSGVRGIYSHKGDAETRVTVTNATFTFNGTNNSHHNCGIYAEDGNVFCRGNTTINLSNGASNNRGIYSAGNGYIAFGLSGDNVTTRQTTITVANGQSANNYGIYSTGGRIYGYGTTNITLGADGSYSTNSQGIYSTGGTITLGRENSQDKTTITVYGNNSATGYSTGNFGIQTSSGTINAHGAIDIDVTGVSSSGILATTGSTINVYGVIDCTIDMASSDSVNRELSSPAVYVNGGNIVINSTATTEETHSTITSDGFGLVVNDGDITVTNGRIDVTTTRTTAVYLTGGKLDIAEAATMNVNSRINADCEWAMGDDASLQGANIYNGVYVRGGSLISNGTLNVEHVGVENDDYTGFNNLIVKSYAVRVEAEGTEADSTQVTITSGTIINQVVHDGDNEVAGGGGGIYVSGQQALNNDGNPLVDDSGNPVYTANVTLGAELAEGETVPTLTVSSTGTQVRDGNNSGMFREEGWDGSWDYKENVSGGHAVEVVGGGLTIHYGTYSAAQGNGILVRGGNVTVNDGTFTGNDVYTNINNNDSAPAGAAASYAFKLYGGTLNIHGGRFGIAGNLLTSDNYSSYSKGSGAFAMGSSSTDTATVNMYGGTINVAGTTGFAVYSNATVNFGQTNTEGPTIHAESTGITLEQTKDSEGTIVDSNSTVNIYSGTYESYNSSGNKNGIWYGARATQLNISGGNINGTGEGAGLRLDSALTKSNIVHITGGTFEGLHGLYYGVDGGGGTNSNGAIYANDGLLIENGTFNGTHSGVYLNDNPWSRYTDDNGTWWTTDDETTDYNNVAIIGGTFEGDSYAIYAPDDVKEGDIFQTHYGDHRWGQSTNPYINGNIDGGAGDSVNSFGVIFTLVKYPLQNQTP